MFQVQNQVLIGHTKKKYILSTTNLQQEALLEFQIMNLECLIHLGIQGKIGKRNIQEDDNAYMTIAPNMALELTA
jgi:hypothetical protein